jgi:trimeric autotransporter adhesin
LIAWKRFTTFLRTCTAVMLCATLATPVLPAEPPASEHHGQVKFAGMPVPGVTITATQGDKKLIAITDQQGVYTFRDIPDGAWTLQAEMLGFVPLKQEITLSAQVPFNPTWELKLMSFDEMKAIAPAAPPMPKPTASPSSVPTEIAATPAATPAAGNGKALPAAPTGAAPGANGRPGFQRANVNATGQEAAKPEGESGGDAPADEATKSGATEGFLVNGSVNNGAASPFAQSAAFGNNRRAGRSLYNASIAMVFDNSSWDARQFSVTGQDVPKPLSSRIQGSANFGGPLKVPHWRNQPVINIGYQWVHNRNAPTSNPMLMPVDALRNGDFSQALNPIGLPVQVFDPVTHLQFPGNVIPSARLNPQAQALLKFYPEPNFNGSSVYNYQVPLVSITHQDSLRTSFNQNINQKNQMNGMFAFQSTRADSTSAFNFLDVTDSFGINSNVNFTHRVSNRMFLTFGYNFSRLATTTTPFFANRANISQQLGITGNNQDAVNWGPPSLGFSSGISSLSDARYASNRNETNAFSFGTFWNHNPHNIRYGVDYRRQEFNSLSQQNPRGSFGFTGIATSQLAAGLPVSGTGSDMADFLLGVPDTSSIAFGNADKYFRSNFDDAYLNDDWRINSSFTFNGGIRWEYSSPISEKYGRLVNLDIAPGYTNIAPVVGFNPVGSLTGQHYPSTLVNPERGAIQPRLGIAWRPLPASSLVVRAGYTVTYNTSVYQGIASQMAQQSPLSKNASLANSAATPLTLANGFSSSPTSVTNTFAMDPNFRIGYAQTWNLSVQRDLPWALQMSSTYLGIKGTRGQQEFLPNTYPLGATNPCPACQSGYYYLTSNGNSTRQSGALQLRRRLHNGFTSTLNYTYSKSIDDSALGGRGGASVIAQNWLNLAAERGLSTFDQRHVLTLQSQYSTGVGLGGGTLMEGWRGKLFKDWTFVSNISVGSGLPLTPTDPAAAVPGTGVTGPVRPHYTGLPVYAAKPGYYLNAAAYTAPISGQWGDAGRDSIIGPGQFSLNASMSRTFRLTDRLNGDLRIDSTNTLNHVVLSGWVTNISSGQFGLPTGANGMRTLQTTFRVRF